MRFQCQHHRRVIVRMARLAFRRRRSLHAATNAAPFEPRDPSEHEITIAVDALSMPLLTTSFVNSERAFMTRIALVVSDVDGTLLTEEKILSDGPRDAARNLHAAGISSAIASSRPRIGMDLLIEPLGITLPVGASTKLHCRFAAENYRATLHPSGNGATQPRRALRIRR